MSFLFRKAAEMPTAETALPGRDATMPVVARHLVLDTPITPPFPEGFEQIVVGMGCFWGAERLFWQAHGVYTTAVGYAGGFTPNPTYEEACSGRTGHAEVVLAVYDPAKTSYEEMLRIFWEGHDPTPGHAPGERRRHAVPLGDLLARRAPARRRARLARHVPGRAHARRATETITTEIAEAGPFYYAEPYHQQYLAANPNGYCGLGGTGVSCPAPATAASE